MRILRHAFRFTIIAIFVFFGFGQSAFSGSEGTRGMQQAAGIDSQTLMTFCNSHYDTDFGICSGYIMAVSETMMSGQPIYNQRSCGHDGIKAQQLVDLVRMSVSDDKDITKLPAGPMVATILAKSFPCL